MKNQKKNQQTKAKHQLQSEKQQLAKLFDLKRQQSVRNTCHRLDHETFLRTFKGKETPDAELIADYIVNHNQQAFEELYKRHHSNMLAYVTAIIKDEDEAQDVLQDAWMAVLESIRNGSYLNVKDFGGWFKSTCYRMARQWKLEKQRFMHGNENMPDKPDRSFNAEQRLINAETEMLLYKASHCLDEEDRHIVILRAWDERSFNEIAVIHHLEVNTARKRYCRAVKKMKQLVESGRR